MSALDTRSRWLALVVLCLGDLLVGALLALGAAAVGAVFLRVPAGEMQEGVTTEPPVPAIADCD
jgi:hypothetical protein